MQLLMKEDSRMPETIEMMHGHARRVARTGISDVCFSLFGEFDIYNKHHLADALASHIAFRTVTLDFAQTKFIDAGILGVLARFAGLRRDVGAARLQLINVNRHFRRLLSICRLDTNFRIEDGSLEEKQRDDNE